MEAVNYAELHFHLLPGVDDGPSSVEESIELARAAAADGTGTIVATPHVHRLHITDPSEIAERVAELTAHLRQHRIEIDVRAGGELADPMVGRLSQAQLDAIAQGPPGRRWLLLEAPFRGMDADYRAAADEVRERGFAVLMAHPERAMKGGRTAQAVLDRELTVGSAVQLTASSVLGRYGRETKDHALRLLRSAPLALLASDAHGGERMPSLRPALHALKAASKPNPARLAGEIPRTLLDHGLERPRARMVA
jgi:protein-tyrosine phosphatase